VFLLSKVSAAETIAQGARISRVCGVVDLPAMTLTTQIGLTFDGRCEAAFKFYERCLNGSIAFLLKWKDSPMANDAAPEWQEKVMHARLMIGDTAILGADVRPHEYAAPQGFSIILSMDDPAEAERVFQALGENGKVGMPLQETFWAHRFGALSDQFGIRWDINCEKAGGD
jgi:PhnB protein